MLRLNDVTKVYRDGPGVLTALDGIDLVVADGAFLAVMGPSGSGKTTLAMIGAGVERPTSGEVWLDDFELARSTAAQRATLRRRQIGIVFQHDELDPLLTAEENVALPLRLDGCRNREARDAAHTALSRCGVGELAARLPAQLSGGQRQRVAIARAIVGQRTLLVADEPTAAADTVTARAIVELLAELAHAGRAVLMTTHDSRLAGFADDVVFLRDGALVESHDQVDRVER
jgi:putative ABC transport system ATP-binding protein